MPDITVSVPRFHLPSTVLGIAVTLLFVLIGVIGLIAIGPYICAQPIRTVNGVSYCGPPPSR